MSTVEWGTRGDKGNLVGIQSALNAPDFMNARRFKNSLKRYLNVASAQGWLNKKTVVTFGEYIGTWLVAVDEPLFVYHLPRQTIAMAPLLLSNARSFVKNLVTSCTSKEKITEAVFRTKAQDMARVYVKTFSELAREFKVTIVAGSIVLPEPSVINGELCIGDGPLENVTAVFAPDGSLHPELSRKMMLINRESSFTSSTAKTLPVFKTALGKLGVLICADSWYEGTYKAFEDDVDAVVVTSLAFEKGLASKPWMGYDGPPNNETYNKDDIGRITEREAWHKYSLPQKINLTKARAGQLVYARGKVWDIDSDGRSFSVKNGELFETPPTPSGECIMCLWL